MGVSEKRIGQQPPRTAANDAARLRLVAAEVPEAPEANARGPLSRLFDRLLALWSLVPNDPVLDTRAFAWTENLRTHWRTIRDEGANIGFGNLDRCPKTHALLGAVPGLVTARFAMLAPGEHHADHRGPSKALVTCHLGLVVPRDGDVRMRVDDRIVRWAEGQTLVFDDSFSHEAWNDSANARVVLLLQFKRPLRQPGRAIADRLLHRLSRPERQSFRLRA